MLDIDRIEGLIRFPPSASLDREMLLELVAELRELRASHSYALKPIEVPVGAKLADLNREADAIMKTIAEQHYGGAAPLPESAPTPPEPIRRKVKK